MWRARSQRRLFGGAILAIVALASASLHAQDATDKLRAPVVRTHVDAIYPPGALASGKHENVVLEVTVDADGHVSEVKVTESGGKDLDEAAVVAIRQWTFDPALRGTKPISSRIRVPFHFAPPAPPPDVAPPPTGTEGPTEGSGSSAASQSGSGTASTVSTTATEVPPLEVTVRGQTTPTPHGSSDFHITVGALRLVPRANASDYLKLAPGILLSNEGGDGHAEQVFLRGFDAREGQDLEFSVDGVPINDSGNIHGNGYADTHFIIPELIQGLRVTEGPFSPHQGNFAVAGSADYHLGLETRGLTAKTTYGSFNTQRLLLMWGPPGESQGTFGGVEAYSSSGYGQNRASTRTSAMAQYEIPLQSGATIRVGGQAYATHFQTAGVIREDDLKAGRVDFFGTEDPLQGGDASRFSIYANYDKSSTGQAIQQSLFIIRRDMRLREDFTGFLLDTQNVLDTLHNQRGDLIDMSYGAWTMGGRGLGRWSTLLGGLEQSIDLGYLARVDLTTGTQYRNTVPGNIPYRLETDLTSTLTDVGMYADTSLRPFSWLLFRGGARVDTFNYDVLNNCAAQGDFDNPSKTDPPINQSCHDQMQLGAHREPVQRSSTAAVKVMPRVTAQVGPIEHFNISVSYGTGVRSIDPAYISQDLDTPFASVRAYEGGVTYASDLGPAQISARSIFFETKVDRDLVFSQTEGRNVLSNGTTRTGWAGTARVAGAFFDDSANLTLVRPTFDDTHLPIPYVPTMVFREDGALFHELPWKFSERAARASLGLGWTYVGRRALPYNQQSDILSVVDANAALGWNGWELSFAVTNLFDRRYRLGEYNYASDFHSAPEPTLTPARAFTAGAPRGMFVSLSANFGGSS